MSNELFHSTPPPSENAEALLKRYFGFDRFRPLQKEIIEDTLAGKDVIALLPTGGGKSLCYQLPSVAREGLTVVISPLISLMKDQVDSVESTGIAATFLNSSIGKRAASDRYRGLNNGEYRLLYLAPERLMIPGMLDDIQRWCVNLIAIDEAHCISEWGHDFRPEYRRLSTLRTRFPGVPLMALTATATERVREDIVEQLHIGDSSRYVASFNRPNLIYRVIAKEKPYRQVLEIARSRNAESGIIYCQSRKSVESLAERLKSDGINALPYHAGLPAKERASNQELFIRDEVKVVCATIAFGMGIDKPNVRFVIHYDLPKNVEGYYQETGRAGRDGLPAECVLLFSAADVIKHQMFINEKPNPNEQRIAREQLNQMIHYAEAAQCRRVSLLEYFGESFGESNCGGCDNCTDPREQFDGTTAAQKFLSCVYRIWTHSRLNVGLNHIVETLTGADTEKIRRWGHDQLSTYGIGNEYKRADWTHIGRQLVRLGLLHQSTEKFATIEITEAGCAALKERTPISLFRPVTAIDKGSKKRVGDIECDENLFVGLRKLRKELADTLDVPAYVIFSDVALREMARFYPTTDTDLLKISGVGEKKLNDYGDDFIEAIRDYLKTYPRQSFGTPRNPETSASTPTAQMLTGTTAATVQLFNQGVSARKIAEQRGLTAGTVGKHLEEAILAGVCMDLENAVNSDAQSEIANALRENPGTALSSIRHKLRNKYEFWEIRLVQSEMNR